MRTACARLTEFKLDIIQANGSTEPAATTEPTKHKRSKISAAPAKKSAAGPKRDLSAAAKAKLVANLNKAKR